jgi:hypothetical protein
MTAHVVTAATHVIVQTLVIAEGWHFTWENFVAEAGSVIEDRRHPGTVFGRPQQPPIIMMAISISDKRVEEQRIAPPATPATL